MIQPYELKLGLPMNIPDGIVSTTTKVWDILVASHRGDLEAVKEIVDECPELIYAQYNYTPPIHFAVREGHPDLVNYLLEQGAYDPTYRIYPFLESLVTIAEDRGHNDIANALIEYADNPSRQKYNGDNGKINFNRTKEQQEFEDAVHTGDIRKAEQVLKAHPDFASDETYFWGEGILTIPVKHQEQKLVELLLNYGAKVPAILKWTQFYYFKFYNSAKHIMERGMNPDVMSWHAVTILLDMAQKGEIEKAELLIKHGAAINTIEEEYQSTPLGMAVRWGHIEMVRFLLSQGADPNKSGATWATPLAWARRKRYEAIEKILIDAGAKE